MSQLPYEKGLGINGTQLEIIPTIWKKKTMAILKIPIYLSICLYSLVIYSSTVQMAPGDDCAFSLLQKNWISRSQRKDTEICIL